LILKLREPEGIMVGSLKVPMLQRGKEVMPVAVIYSLTYPQNYLY